MEMVKSEKVLLFSFLAIFLFVLITCLAVYIANHSLDIKYVKMEIKRADNENERKYWKKELHKLYWCLIPGVTPRLIKKVKRFYRKTNKKVKNLFSIIIALWVSFKNFVVETYKNKKAEH